ncbi:hypothetical protein BDV32DRAFT_133990 [Aspergillus pseudonomiae]|nr:hypothetical protein BDV32DRAFT_133990 [Aspergillus pseudonomiae]
MFILCPTVTPRMVINILSDTARPTRTSSLCVCHPSTSSRARIPSPEPSHASRKYVVLKSL